MWLAHLVSPLNRLSFPFERLRGIRHVWHVTPHRCSWQPALVVNRKVLLWKYFLPNFRWARTAFHLSLQTKLNVGVSFMMLTICKPADQIFQSPVGQTDLKFGSPARFFRSPEATGRVYSHVLKDHWQNNYQKNQFACVCERKWQIPSTPPPYTPHKKNPKATPHFSLKKFFFKAAAAAAGLHIQLYY